MTRHAAQPTDADDDPAAIRALYADLTAEFLARPGVGTGRMLQNEGLSVGGRYFAFLKDTRLVAKIPAEQASLLVAAEAAEPFESGGRPMREWVCVAPCGPDTEAVWRGLMTDAYTYVSGLKKTTR